MVQIPKIIGFPPDQVIEGQNMLINSIPIMMLKPCLPEFEAGIQLFRLSPSMDKYNERLSQYGFSFGGDNWIRIAFRPESFTEDFSAEYGETFFSKLTDVVSGGLADLAYILGTRTAGEAGRKAVSPESAQGKIVREAQEQIARMAGEFLGESAVEKLSKALHMVGQALAGQRFQFPLVWKNSAFSPSYDATITLYNPKPKDPESTRKYIVGPLVALLLFTVPQSADGTMYSWPFLCEAKCPGIFYLRAGCVTSVNITKNIEQYTAYNQQLGIVEVRISLRSLYSVLVDCGSTLGALPRLHDYVEVMKETKETRPVHSLGSSPSDQRGGKGGRLSQLGASAQPLTRSSDFNEEPKSRVSPQDQAIAKLF
jgi:hypothetical protein